MNVLQGGRKIGFTHRLLRETSTGCHFLDTASMRITTMGTVQDIDILTEGNLGENGTLLDFRFDLRSDMFRFSAWGVVNGRELTLYRGSPGREKKDKIPLHAEPRMTGMLFDTAIVKGLAIGKPETLYVLDPSTMAELPVTVTAVGDETVTIMGREREARKVLVSVMGASQTVWLAPDGETLREEGILGIVLERTTKEDAERRFSFEPSSDLVEIASLPSGRLPALPSRLSELRVRLNGPGLAKLALDGGRQTFSRDIVTVRREMMTNTSSPVASKGEEKSFLKPSAFIESDSPAVRDKVGEIITLVDSHRVRAEKIVAWLYTHLEKKPVISVPDALDTLKNMAGDCNEHAILLAALARAAGIPAQVEAGLVYHEGRFYYHAWNSLFLNGQWVTADGALGQLPADVTHIRFVRGSTGNQVDLLGVIGRLKLEVIGAEKP